MTASSYESRDSLMSRDSTRDEVNNSSSLDDVFHDSTTENGPAQQNHNEKRPERSEGTFLTFRGRPTLPPTFPRKII